MRILVCAAVAFLLAGCAPTPEPRAPRAPVRAVEGSDRPRVGPSPRRAAPAPAASPVAVAPSPSPSPSPAASPSATPDWEGIDAHARGTPKSATGSVKALARHLVKPARSDAEKARALYSWIALNIRYDTEAFFADRPSAGTAEEVLKTRLSVCNGYARLYEALAKEAGLEARLVSGYGRGYGCQPGDPIPKESNHAWNAVKVDGQWRLLDSTWGAGHLDEDGSFVRSFDDFWFLTPPKQFLATHYPEEPRWQLLPKPVDGKAFTALPDVTPDFYRAGLILESHDTSVIRTDGALTVEVGAPDGVDVFASLERDGQALDDVTLVQRRPGGYTVGVLFPKAGTYDLQLFAGRPSPSGQPLAVTWRVKAAQGTPGATWPATFLAYRQRSARLERPRTGTLAAGRSVEFDLQAPGAEEMMVQSSAGQVTLSRSGDRFVGKATPGPGEVVLFARYPGQERFEGLVRYQAR